MDDPYLMVCGRCVRPAFLRVLSICPDLKTKRYGIQCHMSQCPAQMTSYDRDLLIQRWNERELHRAAHE